MKILFSNMNCIRFLSAVERLATTCLKIQSTRCISQHPIKFLNVEKKWRERDNVSEGWRLIYKAPMDTAINYTTTYLTFSTTTISVASVYYAAFVFDPAKINDPFVIGENVVIANNSMECLIYLGAFIAFHLALKILLSKYVIRMYQKEDNYIAIFRGHIYNSIRKHKFHLNDFTKLNPTFVVSWGDARFDIGNKHAIILENYFKTPEYFSYLLNKKSRDIVDDD